jgi:integrase
MKASITVELLRKLPPGPVDIRDTKLPGFVLRVRPNGTASYLAALGRGRWHTIGPTSLLDPHEAREEARGLLGDVAKARSRGDDPFAAARARKAAKGQKLTFEQFLEQHYQPWKIEHHKRGAETTQRLKSVFEDFLSMRLTEINAWAFEKWRTARLKGTGAKKRPKPATVNSHLTMLKAALEKAVLWKLLPAHPLNDVKAVTADKTGRIRYLSGAEEKQLRAALVARDQARQARRERANVWRRARKYSEWPELADHLAPIVLLALNTGLRKGEIFGLRWCDVNLEGAQLCVRGEGAKSGQTRFVPLNAEALNVLRQWQTATQATGRELVFAGREDDQALVDVKKSWLPVIRAAGIKRFTFHDLRHTFASKLVMVGTDLNTVRELLGHADIKMTLRYAHLAPEHKAAAVAKLVSA